MRVESSVHVDLVVPPVAIGGIMEPSFELGVCHYDQPPPNQIDISSLEAMRGTRSTLSDNVRVTGVLPPSRLGQPAWWSGQFLWCRIRQMDKPGGTGPILLVRVPPTSGPREQVRR